MHVDDKEVGPAVSVGIDRAGVACPAGIDKPGRRGRIDESAAVDVVEQPALLEAFGLEVPREGVRKRNVIFERFLPLLRRKPTVLGNLLGGELADVGQEQVEPAVAIVVKEDGREGVTAMVQAGSRGDLLELPSPVIEEQPIARAHLGDVQVGIAIIVDVRERDAGANTARRRDSGGPSDVLEPAASQVAVERVVTGLVDEVDVEPAVAVNVGDRHAAAMVVVCGLVILSAVVDDLVPEPDAALLDAVGEFKLMKGPVSLCRLELVATTADHPGRKDVYFLGHRRPLRQNVVQGVPEVGEAFGVQAVIVTSDASERVDQDELRAVNDGLTIAVGVIVGGQVEALMTEAVNLTPGTGQERPDGWVGPHLIGVGAKDFGGVVRRVEADAHEPDVIAA